MIIASTIVMAMGGAALLYGTIFDRKDAYQSGLDIPALARSVGLRLFILSSIVFAIFLAV